MNTLSLPQLDIQDFLSDHKRHLFIELLGKGFEDYGFIIVRNALIDSSDIARFYEAVAQFFSLPLEVKLKYCDTQLAGQRGYTAFGQEHAKGSTVPDLKEFWQMGQPDSVKPSDYPSNFDVAEVPDFNILGSKLFTGFEATAVILLRAIAQYLDLPSDYFDPFIRGGNSILRAIHYPPITEPPHSAIRAEAHEDINLITLLVGASAQGLQLLSKHNQWLDITCPDDCLIVNVGDMLQRLTNDKLKSTTHRVVNPPPELWHTPRYSIPFFMHPISSMDLTCLPQCIPHGHEPKYEPITAGEYLEQRLIEIGLLKK